MMVNVFVYLNIFRVKKSLPIDWADGKKLNVSIGQYKWPDNSLHFFRPILYSSCFVDANFDLM